LMLSEQGIHLVWIGDVGFEEFVAVAVFFDHAVEIGQVPGICQHVDVANLRRFIMLQDVSNEIAADKSAATRDQNSHSGR